MTCELLGMIPQSLHRPLDCIDGNWVSQACGMSMIWAVRAVLMCRVQSKLWWCTQGFLTVLWVTWVTNCIGLSGGTWHLDVLVPHWVRLLSRASSCSGYLLSPVRHIWEVILGLGSWKFWVSIPLGSLVIAGESSQALVHSAEESLLVMAEVPSGGAGLWDFWDL